MRQPTLETARLLLRPFRTADADRVQLLAGDRAIADTTLNIPHPYEDGLAEKWISNHRDWFDRGEQVVFAVTLKRPDSDASCGASASPAFNRTSAFAGGTPTPQEDEAPPLLIGSVSLRIDHDDDRAELGYWIGRPYWNHGYCTEAIQALIRFGFEQLGLNRIQACHFTRNPASGRVMQKAGMTYEGRLHQHVKKWDAYEDIEIHAILRGDASLPR